MSGTSEQPKQRWAAAGVVGITAPTVVGGIAAGSFPGAFYLTLRVLPSQFAPSGWGRLFTGEGCRHHCTDTRLLPPSRRLDHLLVFRDQISWSGWDGAVAANLGRS